MADGKRTASGLVSRSSGSPSSPATPSSSSVSSSSPSSPLAATLAESGSQTSPQPQPQPQSQRRSWRPRTWFHSNTAPGPLTTTTQQQQHLPVVTPPLMRISSETSILDAPSTSSIANMPPIALRGFIEKQGYIVQKYQRRYIQQEANLLNYYTTANSDAMPRGSIDLFQGAPLDRNPPSSVTTTRVPHRRYDSDDSDDVVYVSNPPHIASISEHQTH